MMLQVCNIAHSQINTLLMRFLFLFLLIGQIALAQPTAFQRFNAPVTINGRSVIYPFAGGLNAPQFSAADLNQDGIQDLVLFDRAGDVFLTFLNEGKPNQSSYIFAPDYACFFPKLRDFALLRDYNRDGAADIFCASLAPASQEMEVYRGYYENKILKFRRFRFTYPASCTNCNSEHIYFPDNDQPGFWNNLNVSKADVPDVDDIDGDGDLDILTFAASVGGHMWYLKNTSVESGFGTDSLRFILADECWGRFYESGFVACKNDLSANRTDCSEGLSGLAVDDRDPLHPGSTVMTYDHDGDGDKEVVLGDISFGCLNMMTNGGDANTAWMVAQDTLFPANSVPVNIINFPAPFYLDLNNDGKKDLIAALNSEGVGEDRKGVWYYPNRGSNSNHRFELLSRSFMTDEMIDVGSIAHPAFGDVNGDGLLDLVIGNYGYYTNATGGTNASLYLFLNTGTASEPRFELTDTNWSDFAQYAPNDFDFSPAFGDLDSDGDVDLLVGSNFGALFYYNNVAGPGKPMILERNFDLMWLLMDVGQSSTPYIRDMDGDGLQDILMGEKLGNINYYKNIGAPGLPKFNAAPTVDRIGAIDARLPNEAFGYSTPVTVAASDNAITLITGAQSGQLEAYNLGTLNNQPYTPVSLTWGNVDEGDRSHPAFADLNGDGLLEMAVGTYRGGVALYSTQMKDCSMITSVKDASGYFALTAFPNPAGAWVRVPLPSDAPAQWRAVNVLGHTIASGELPGSLNVLQCTTDGWVSGWYMLEVQQDNRRMLARVLIQK
jgi:hypothetical protein